MNIISTFELAFIKNTHAQAFAWACFLLLIFGERRQETERKAISRFELFLT